MHCKCSTQSRDSPGFIAFVFCLFCFCSHIYGCQHTCKGYKLLNFKLTSLYVGFLTGNVFTSLEGIELVWELKTVEGVGSVNAQSILKYVIQYSVLSP